MTVPILKIADGFREEFARSQVDLRQTPDEYAAREAHKFLLFDLDDYSYRDQELHSWIHRFGAILRGVEGMPSIEELRLRYLSQSERDAIAREQEDDEGL
ncbi:hypothetical protein [Rubrivivax albus]|uniref:hypothetical protein n=1 Tax=Rubrivivax albus TaxID=2499835 RepID=UPI001305178C|nr:hypothetical protein [Rubrivivax albus]